MKNVFYALSDDSRIKIIELLRKRNYTAGELSEYFNFSKPTLSHHLNVLKNAGLISSIKKGQFIYYSLELTVLDEIIFFMKKIKGGKK